MLKCKGSLRFIDATTNGGVSTCSWKNFVKKKYYEGYSCIVYRPLHFKRNYDILTKLELFLKVKLLMN